jgi:hypothetical protein
MKQRREGGIKGGPQISSCAGTKEDREEKEERGRKRTEMYIQEWEDPAGIVEKGESSEATR